MACNMCTIKPAGAGGEERMFEFSGLRSVADLSNKKLSSGRVAMARRMVVRYNRGESAGSALRYL